MHLAYVSVRLGFGPHKQLLVVEIPDSRTERKPQQMQQGKDMIGETRGTALKLRR